MECHGQGNAIALVENTIWVSWHFQKPNETHIANRMSIMHLQINQLYSNHNMGLTRSRKDR